jgi:flagellar protein FliO/FliZ
MPGAPAAIPGTPANPGPAARANPAPIQVGQAAAAPSAGTLVQTILALMLVLGLLAALAWAMKRYGPRVAGNPANLRMVGALNIGGRERIMVVEVGDQWIVVGASPGRVNALATMPKGEGTAATAALAGHAPPAATFSDWLKQTIDKRNAK